MATGVNLGAAVGTIGRIQWDKHCQEGAWEALPGDEVLVQAVAARSGRLVDQLVLEQAGGLAVERGQHGQQAWILGDAAAHRPNVHHRIEGLEQTGAGLEVRLPAAAQVIGVDQLAALEECIGLGMRSGMTSASRPCTTRKPCSR